MGKRQVALRRPISNLGLARGCWYSSPPSADGIKLCCALQLQARPDLAFPQGGKVECMKSWGAAGRESWVSASGGNTSEYSCRICLQATAHRGAREEQSATHSHACPLLVGPCIPRGGTHCRRPQSGQLIIWISLKGQVWVVRIVAAAMLSAALQDVAPHLGFRSVGSKCP